MTTHFIQMESEPERIMRQSNDCANAAGFLIAGGAWDDDPALYALLCAADMLALYSMHRAALERLAGVPQPGIFSTSVTTSAASHVPTSWWEA